jgi:hypothetical protein
MLNDAEWSGWSNVAIAKACAVSHMTVRRPKAELTSSSGSDRTYRNNHGSVSTMNTAANRQTSRPSASSTLMVAASQTKEGWHLSFRALVPRLGLTSNEGAVGRFAAYRKRIAARRREEANPEGSLAKVPEERPFPRPQAGGSDAPHVWVAQFSRVHLEQINDRQLSAC